MNVLLLLFFLYMTHWNQGMFQTGTLMTMSGQPSLPSENFNIYGFRLITDKMRNVLAVLLEHGVIAGSCFQRPSHIWLPTNREKLGQAHSRAHLSYLYRVSLTLTGDKANQRYSTVKAKYSSGPEVPVKCFQAVSRYSGWKLMLISSVKRKGTIKCILSGVKCNCCIDAWIESVFNVSDQFLRTRNTSA